MTKCPTCRGTGFNLDDADLPPDDQSLCETCGGEGSVMDDEDNRLSKEEERGDKLRDDEMLEG